VEVESEIGVDAGDGLEDFDALCGDFGAAVVTAEDDDVECRHGDYRMGRLVECDCEKCMDVCFGISFKLKQTWRADREFPSYRGRI
jgi:hypothetical protein